MYFEHKLRLPDDETLKGRLNQLCRIYTAGVNYELFWGIISNRWNDKPSSTRPTDWNLFDVEGWVVFYKKHGFKTDVYQLELVFKYLTTYYSGPSIFISQSGTRYQANHRSHVSHDDLIIERIALMALEC
ncbi:hypothetical protein C5O00_06985 [Pukyongia salina]|uniref:Uncharacterized protein n=1 Tax=Pukyongia salina TaxID=2094025 RepID=A0A2S0HXN5_9FLAO|nr:hypothetical protein [Pukyongia salina]AVI50933.1 hypothetical protein C5O00_06985 [Pukyongia salina]